MRPSKKIEDAWLIAQYCNGHKNALAILVKRWHVPFCKQAYRYTNDFDSAKDIAQDTWITILEKIDSITHPNKFGSWGLSIVTRKSIDWYRQHQRTLEKQQKIRNEETVAILEEANILDAQGIHDELKIAIALLPVTHQHVLTLFYIESYGLHEISQILNISKGTVKSRLYYAREKLKITLNNRNHEKRI